MKEENGRIIYERQEMFGERICIVVDSLLETFMAIYLKASSLWDKQVDLVVTDHIRQYRELSGRIARSELFDRVMPAEATEFEGNRVEFAEIYSVIAKPHAKYDTLIISELDKFSRGLYVCLKSQRKNMVLHLLGEGILSYSGLETLIREGKEREARYKDALYEYKAVISCNIRWMKDTFNGVYELPAFQEAYLDKINSAFGYTPHQQMYENRIVFLEESYAADSCIINDVELAEWTASHSRSKILLKKHPRSRDNRFGHIKNLEIIDPIYPLEIMVLNGDFKNCFFVCAYSIGVINLRYMFLCDIKTIMLARLMDISQGSMRAGWLNELHRFIENVIFQDSHFFVPETKEELADLIENISSGMDRGKV